MDRHVRADCVPGVARYAGLGVYNGCRDLEKGCGLYEVDTQYVLQDRLVRQRPSVPVLHEFFRGTLCRVSCFKSRRAKLYQKQGIFLGNGREGTLVGEQRSARDSEDGADLGRRSLEDQ